MSRPRNRRVRKRVGGWSAIHRDPGHPPTFSSVTRPLRFAPLLLALALHTAAAQTAPARPVTIPLAPYGPAPMRTVAVTIADTTYDFLFDTGGGVTTISPALAARLGCTPAGRTRGYRMTGEYLEAPVCRDVALSVGGHAARVEAAVMELKPYGDMAVPPVHGMISLHTLAGRALTLDLPHDRVIVESAASLRERVRTRAPLRLRLATGLDGASLDAYVGVPAGPAMLWLLWDSGHQATTFVAPHAAQRLGLADTVPDRSSGVVTLALAPGIAARTPVMAKRIIHDGVLSAGALARAEWTIDLAGDRMWVGPVRPLLEPPAVATAPVPPPSADPTGWYDVTLVVGGDRQQAVLRVERAGAGLTGRLRFVGDEKELALRDVRAHDATLEFQLPMRQVYPVRLTFRALTGTGTWGDPATRGGAVEGTKRS